MTISARILADSICGGSRLTTWELTYARFVHAELLTYGMFARNAASSRAIPAARLRERTLADPATHVWWGANQKGMSATNEVDDVAAAKAWWHESLVYAQTMHAKGERLGLHKQVVNRIIEPWMHITVILTATDYANFFHQRRSEYAEPNIHALADAMWDAYHSHMPIALEPGDWHLPLVDPSDYWAVRELGYETYAEVVEALKRVSVGRCARVSYLTHDGRRDLREDLRLHDDLAANGHWSPFEHVAQAIGDGARHKKYEGWRQYRADFIHENGPSQLEGRCSRCGCWAGNHVTTCPEAS